MQNEQPLFGDQTTQSETQVDKEWSEFQRDLDLLGRQLSELQTHTAALGNHFVASLEARFQEVKIRAESFRKAREEELDQVGRNAWKQAEGAFSEARTRSAEAARQVWERSEPLRQGAKDVGEGLLRAWGELRASFGKAVGRLHTESETSMTSGPVPATTDDRRETT
jgi:hypothetical protein